MIEDTVVDVDDMDTTADNNESRTSCRDDKEESLVEETNNVDADIMDCVTLLLSPAATRLANPVTYLLAAPNASLDGPVTVTLNVYDDAAPLASRMNAVNSILPGGNFTLSRLAPVYWVNTTDPNEVA